MKTFKSYYIEETNKLDQLQAALDVAGFEPTVGTGADAVNTIISGLRAAAAKNTDQRKEHIINAGISAISMIPFADVIKLLKLRKLGRPATKLAVKGARNLKAYGKERQATNRFDTTNRPQGFGSVGLTQNLTEEYSYMYDQIKIDDKFPILKKIYKSDYGDQEYRYINREWKDVKEKVYLFYEAEYKRAKLPDKIQLFNPIIDKLYSYFKNLYDAYMEIFEWDVERGEAREMIEQDWYHINRVDKPDKDDPRDPFTRKILAINSIINLIHRDTTMLTRYLKDGWDSSIKSKNKSWEEGPSGQLEAFLNTMSNDPGKFKRRWDKEIEKEFDIRIVNGQVLR